MKLTSLNFLLIGALLAWFTGCGFLLFGYVDELAEPNLYQPAICIITSYNIARSNYSNLWTYNLELTYKTCSEWISIQTVSDKASVESRFNTQIAKGSSFPCLAVISTINPAPGTNPNNTSSTASLYVWMPENITPLTVAGVLYLIAFITTVIYFAVGVYIQYKRRHYQRLEGTDTDAVILVRNPPLLDDENLVTGSFADAQKVFWANEKLYSTEDFGVLKKLQVDAIIDPKGRRIFQLTLASHLRRLASNQ